MYRRNLKAIIVAFVLVSGFGIGTAAHVSAADTMSPQGAAQSKSVNQNVATGTKVVQLPIRRERLLSASR